MSWFTCHIIHLTYPSFLEKKFKQLQRNLALRWELQLIYCRCCPTGKTPSSQMFQHQTTLFHSLAKRAIGLNSSSLKFQPEFRQRIQRHRRDAARPHRGARRDAQAARMKELKNPRQPMTSMWYLLPNESHAPSCKDFISHSSACENCFKQACEALIIRFKRGIQYVWIPCDRKWKLISKTAWAFYLFIDWSACRIVNLSFKKNN